MMTASFFSCSSRLALVSLVALFIITPVFSLRCWVCNSEVGGACSDPFNTTYMWPVECPSERRVSSAYHMYSAQRPVCKKVKQKERGRLIYLRSCGLESIRGEACGPDSDRSFSDDVQFCETCDTEQCNAATTSAPSLVLAIALPAALLPLYLTA